MVSVRVVLYLSRHTDFFYYENDRDRTDSCSRCKNACFDWGGTGIYAVSTVLANEIWFVLGMSVSTFNVELRKKKLQGTVIGLLFLGLSIAVYMTNVQSLAVSFALGLMSCATIILLAVAYEDKFGNAMRFLAEYTMPIFLMHTLFAAPLRTVLFKLGIQNAVIHVLLGIAISFIGSMIAAIIMKKTKWLEFFIYPRKFIKMK